MIRKKFLRNRSKPEVSTIANCAGDQQGTVENFATVGQKNKQKSVGKEIQKWKGKLLNARRVKTLSVGSMTCQVREQVDVMERKTMDTLCAKY